MSQETMREFAWLSIDKTYPVELQEKFAFSSLGFRYLPNELSNSGLEPGWNEVEIIGRASPYQVWGAVTAEEWSFTLQLFAESDYYRDVVEKVNWLKSLKKPIFHEGISYRPPALIFIWGDFINQRVLLKSAEPTFQGPWEITAQENEVTGYPLYPLQASVSISLVAV